MPREDDRLHISGAPAAVAPGEAPFFSLIMPAYGVERYIMDSVADILCQTYCDFELIIVDDASPDRSAAIAEEVAGGDPRVSILHHEHNRGVSEARNTGIRAARGTWLMCPDPDDRYETDMLELVANALAESKCDLLVFAHTQEYFDAGGSYLYSNPMPIRDMRIDGKAEIGRIALELEKETHLGYPWNKAYRRSIIESFGLSFETVPYIEDILFNLDYLKHVEALAALSANPYRYAKRLAANLTNAADARYFDVHRRRIQEVRNMLVSRACFDEDAMAVLGSLYARYIMSALERNCSPAAGLTARERSDWLTALYDDSLFCEIIPHAQSDESRALSTCIWLLQTHNTPALLAAGRAIHIVRERSTTLYTKARSKR